MSINIAKFYLNVEIKNKNYKFSRFNKFKTFLS